MKLSREKIQKIKKNLVDAGLYHCTICDNYFIIRNTSDGEFNQSICPCCGVNSEDVIEDIEEE